MLVSGLPRSGTSLMMQMLAAGGMPVLTDNERMADVDNPKGYFEWEASKRLAKEPELLDDDALAGKAIKCISMLLPRMPAKHNYKVIFMTRPIEQVAQSQHAMVKRLNTQGAALDEEQLRRGLTAHREEIRKWIKTAEHVDAMEVIYPALIDDPESVIPALVEFRGRGAFAAPGRIASVIETSLYRQRQALHMRN